VNTLKRQFKTGDTIWKQIYDEQHGEDKDIEHHRGLVELMKNHRDSYLSPGGRLDSERSIFLVVQGNTIISSNKGRDWVSINDFEIVGRDSQAEKGSRYDMEDSVSGKEVGRLQIFRLARRLSDGRRDFEVKFHCKNIEGKESSVRIFNWNENDGSYEVELLSEHVSGTTWIIKCERNIDIAEMRDYLEEQLKFFDTNIYYDFNGTKQIHQAPTKAERANSIYCRKKVNLPNGLGTAYINFSGNGDFKVYNLGIKLRTPLDLDISGISGTIVTDKFLAEDLGRGSLIQSDENVSAIITELKSVGIEHLTNKIKHKSGSDLTHNEREFLLKRARWDTELRQQIETKLIIPRGNDSYTSISRIVQSVNEGNSLFWATGNKVIDDRAATKGFNIVTCSSAVEEILDKFGIKGTPLGEVEAVKQWEGGYKLLDSDEEVEKFFKEVLTEWLNLGMRKAIDSQETPDLRIGSVEDSTIRGWTNSCEYITFRKDILIKEMRNFYKLDTDLQRLEFLRMSNLFEILTHEIAHWAIGDDSIKIAEHGDKFDDALMKVQFVVFGEMDRRIKEMLREQEPKLAEWNTKVKSRAGGDGKPLYSISIPREHAEKLGINENSIVQVALKTAKEMDENYSKRGFSANGKNGNGTPPEPETADDTETLKDEEE